MQGTGLPKAGGKVPGKEGLVSVRERTSTIARQHPAVKLHWKGTWAELGKTLPFFTRGPRPRWEDTGPEWSR